MNRQSSTTPGAWKALSLLLALNLLSYVDRYILAAVEPEIRKTFFAASDPNAQAQTGALATAFLLSYMVTAPIFGALADRVSRWTIIAFGAAAWSFASLGSGFAQTFAFLLITRVLVGIGEAAYGPAAPTILSDLYPVERRGLVLAWFFAAIPFGSALGYVFGGMVSGIWGWRAPFHFAALPGIALAVLCLFFKDHRPAPARREARHSIADYFSIFRIRSYRFNVAAQTAMTFAIGGMSFWAPAYFYSDRGHPSLTQINLVFGGITAVSGLLATIFGGWLGDRLTAKYPSAYFLVSGGGMVVAFPCTLAMIYAPFPLAWVFCFLAVFFVFLNIGPSNTVIANVTTPELCTMAFALNIFIIHAFGDAISPPLIGAVADRSSLGTGFAVISLAMLIAGILWLCGAKSLTRDMERISRQQA